MNVSILEFFFVSLFSALPIAFIMDTPITIELYLFLSFTNSAVFAAAYVIYCDNPV